MIVILFSSDLISLRRPAPPIPFLSPRLGGADVLLLLEFGDQRYLGILLIFGSDHDSVDVDNVVVVCNCLGNGLIKTQES